MPSGAGRGPGARAESLRDDRRGAPGCLGGEPGCRGACPAAPESQAALEIASRAAPSRRRLRSEPRSWPRTPATSSDAETIKSLSDREPKFPKTHVARELAVRAGRPTCSGGESSPSRVTRSRRACRRCSRPCRGPTRRAASIWPAGLSQPNHPLTSRVFVNRVWEHYFGMGLVPTEDNFGLSGEPPSQPELLDWLAAEFIARGWSLKALHRLIVGSATYRQSSHVRPELAGVDPSNRLLARQTRLRLEAEAIRDVALSVSGLLSRKIGGPSVFPYQPEGIMKGRADRGVWVESPGADRYRRGMYTHFWRLTPHPFLRLFDAPDATAACTRRIRTNTPLQALTLLNDPTFTECARALADRLRNDVPEGDRERIRHAFRLCLGREPTRDELRKVERYLHDQRRDAAAVDLAQGSVGDAQRRPKDRDEASPRTPSSGWVSHGRCSTSTNSLPGSNTMEMPPEPATVAPRLPRSKRALVGFDRPPGTARQPLRDREHAVPAGRSGR